LDQQGLQVLQALRVLAEQLEQQVRAVIQAHKALQDLLAHKEHQEQKVTREILEHRVFQ
jgi:hypothetical protein